MGSPVPPKKKRRGGARRRTGCHTCKSRHSRCDEKKPICSNCQRLNLECKQSDSFTLSEWNHTREKDVVSLSASNILGASAPEHSASTWDVFKLHISEQEIASDESPATLHIPTLSLPTPPATAPSPPSTTSVTLTPETASLLQTYLRTVATWMDLMDLEQTYQLSIPRVTLSSPLLFHCICAFTAKYLALANSRRQLSWEPVAQYHYGESLRLLIAALNSPSHEHTLTATLLVSSYEILERLSSEPHRRHFMGAAMLIKSQGITAQSTGVDRANFWIYVRHEIGVALATEKPLVLPLDEWKVQWKKGETREDVLGNQVFWLLSRVLNLVFGERGRTDASQSEREGLLHELEEWRVGLTDAFIGVPYGDEDEEGFRKVYFTVTAAAAAALSYHVSHILLYAEPSLQHESYKELIQDQAMRICNIAISEFPDSLRVNATHQLYYAAKHINGIARKARIWGILTEVEAQLGYHTRSAVKRLQDLVEQGM